MKVDKESWCDEMICHLVLSTLARINRLCVFKQTAQIMTRAFRHEPHSVRSANFVLNV